MTASDAGFIVGNLSESHSAPVPREGVRNEAEAMLSVDERKKRSTSVRAGSVRLLRILRARKRGKKGRGFAVAKRRRPTADDNRAYRKTINLPCLRSYTGRLRDDSWGLRSR